MNESQVSQELFQALSNASDNVYLFSNDLKTGISKWSDQALWYFDMPDGYEKDTIDVWIEKIHEEDREAYLKDINDVFGGAKDYHCVQYRARNRYGDYVWLECTGNVVKDETGQATFFAGLITRLDNQTKYDSVTKLLSYHYFYNQGKIKEDSVVLLLGMDHFRSVIQNYGYEMGNELLRSMADLMNRITCEKTCYRLNGDEFLIVMPGQSKQGALDVFQKLKQGFAKKLIERNIVGPVGFSGAGDVVSVSEAVEDINSEKLIQELEHTMGFAKEKGGGTIVFFSNKIREQHHREYLIHQAVEKAIQNDFEGFEMYYQPIKSRNGQIQTVESLLRFYSKELGWVSPAELIPILEHSGKIRSVGNWVMKRAVAQCKEWNKQYERISVGFNVSYLQLYSDKLILDLIEEVENQEVDPALIVLELTESSRVIYPESLKMMFQKLINYGFRVALDDFGMECSSLTLLRDIPVTAVKVDHSFVRSILGNERKEDQVNLSIISGIITMCKNIGIHVVVEGIENEQIAEIIEDMNVDYLQGYFYSKPVPAKEVEKAFPMKA